MSDAKDRLKKLLDGDLEASDIAEDASLVSLADRLYGIKITILQIKTQKLEGVALENVNSELAALEKILNNLRIKIEPTLVQHLKDINQELWRIEDDIRHQERLQNFDENFIRLARSVYKVNDLRASVKKEINTSYGSKFIEEKSYLEY